MNKSFWHMIPRPIMTLAPMEDVTDTVFRRMVASCGKPDVFFTEFVSTDGLCSEGMESVAYRLRYTESERFLVAQIWGTRPENFAAAACMVREMGFDGVDINMGCPVRKIVKAGACSALIENRSLASEIIRATREASGGLPVSVKTRIGFRKRETEEWASFLLEEAPDLLTIHGRIARDLSGTPADWDEIGRVVALRNQARSPVLILGNGDILDFHDALEKAGRYGVDGVMVGRGIFRNLFFFRPKSRMHEKPKAGEEIYGDVDDIRDLSPAEKVDLLLRHAVLFSETWGRERYFGIMKKFFKIYIAGFPGAAVLRESLNKASSASEVESRAREWLSAEYPAGLK